MAGSDRVHGRGTRRDAVARGVRRSAGLDQRISAIGTVASLGKDLMRGESIGGAG
jgi:hypothetical protein